MKLLTASTLSLLLILTSGCSTVHSTSRATPDGESYSEYKTKELMNDDEVSEPLGIMAGMGLIGVGVIAAFALIDKATE